MQRKTTAMAGGSETGSRAGWASRIVTIMAFLSLAAAWGYGYARRGDDVMPALAAAYPEGAGFTRLCSSPLVYEVAVADTGSTRTEYAAVATGQGYGGPLQVAALIDTAGTVTRTVVVANKETPSWYRRLCDEGFFGQFEGKSVADAFRVGEDVDAITRATVSSRGFTGSIRAGSHHVGRKLLDLPIVERDTGWRFGVDEAVLLGLFAVVLFGLLRGVPKLRWVTLAVGCVFLGFHMHSPIALSSFASILLGYLKPLKENVFWWVLVGGSVTLTFVLDRSFYCFWMCPFGAVQDAFAKLGGFNIRLDRRFVDLARRGSLALTWLALMIAFATSNGPKGSYEPFGTIFGRTGSSAQWYLLPLVILGSFVLRRFWCRFFCPVGVVFGLTVKARRRLNRILERRKAA